MLITVIIPTCNSEKYLIPTLESAINQTYRNIEIIIVDDCSKDKTVSIIKKFLKIDKRIKLIKSNIKKPSGGPATPRNIGIRFAKGDYVAFLDSDDLWQKNKLALQVSSMKKNHFISFTNCNYIIENKIVKENYIRKKFIQFALSYLPEGLLLYNPIRLSTVLLKKSLLKKINFNEESEISGVEDIEMWLNYSVKKYFNNFNYLSDYLVSIRKHKRNLTKDYNLGIIKNIYCLSKFMINNPSIINFKFFLSGILFRIILLIKKNYINEIKKFTYVFFFIFLLFFLITFKSPIPDYLGNKLIVHHGNTSNIENLVIFSSSKYEKSYKKRFNEAMKVYKTLYIKNIYILGNDDAVPEHRILSSLFST
jgi:teichuronic acid biosynthesis glycosyltransferase TuaG